MLNWFFFFWLLLSDKYQKVTACLIQSQRNKRMACLDVFLILCILHFYSSGQASLLFKFLNFFSPFVKKTPLVPINENLEALTTKFFLKKKLICFSRNKENYKLNYAWKEMCFLFWNLSCQSNTNPGFSLLVLQRVFLFFGFLDKITSIIKHTVENFNLMSFLGPRN